jgi:DNA-directed RNA polymerase specialized sigma24 family protein
MKSEILKAPTDLLPERNSVRHKDIQKLHELMPRLSDDAILAVYFRFWEQLLIEDIAKILGRSWKDTDKLIEDAIKQLRYGFLMNQTSRQPKAA